MDRGYRKCVLAGWADLFVALPPVMFVRDGLKLPANEQDDNAKTIDNTRQPWRIYHQNLGWSNVDIDLTFTPITVYKKTDNFLVCLPVYLSNGLAFIVVRFV